MGNVELSRAFLLRPTPTCQDRTFRPVLESSLEEDLAGGVAADSNDYETYDKSKVRLASRDTGLPAGREEKEDRVVSHRLVEIQQFVFSACCGDTDKFSVHPWLHSARASQKSNGACDDASSTSVFSFRPPVVSSVQFALSSASGSCPSSSVSNSAEAHRDQRPDENPDVTRLIGSFLSEFSRS